MIPPLSKFWGRILCDIAFIFGAMEFQEKLLLRFTDLMRLILFNKNSAHQDLYTITLVATVKKKWSFPKSETHHAFSGGWLCCNSTHYDVLEFEKQKGSSMPVRRPSTFHTVGFSQFFVSFDLSIGSTETKYIKLNTKGLSK